MPVVDGRRLRQYRLQRGVTQEGLAEQCGVSPRTVQRWERRPRVPLSAVSWAVLQDLFALHARQLADLLCPVDGGAGAGLELSAGDVGRALGTRSAGEVLTDRRQWLAGAAYASSLAALDWLGPLGGLVDGRVRAADPRLVDYWAQRAWAYGEATGTSAAGALLPGLASEAAELAADVQAARDDKQRERLFGELARFRALLAMSMDDREQGAAEVRRVWVGAQQAAALSADPAVQAWTAGVFAVRSLYTDKHLPGFALQLADAGLARAEDCSESSVLGTAGLQNGLAARAQAAAVLGLGVDAERALCRLRDLTAGKAGADGNLLNGCPEEALRHTEAYVYAHLGRCRETERAAERALALYPAGVAEERALVGLLRAAAWVGAGEVAGGLAQAAEVLQGLGAGWWTGAVQDMPKFDFRLRKMGQECPRGLQDRVKIVEDAHMLQITIKRSF